MYHIYFLHVHSFRNNEIILWENSGTIELYWDGV